MNIKTLFVILDGIGDHGIKDFHGKTPLEAAKKKVIDKLCKYGECGIHSTIDYGITPGSDTGHLALFGYDPYKYYRGRGIFEALGLMDLREGDIAFRVNFGTVNDQKIIIDRRAGRSDLGLEELLSDFKSIIEEIERKYGVKIILKHGVEHRGILVIRGKDLSEKVTDIDKHKIGIKLEKSIPLDENAKETADIINELVEKFYEVSKNHSINKKRKEMNLPPINALLLRGASKYTPLKKEDLFYNRYNVSAAFIAGAPMYLGVAKYVGMYTYKPLGATGTINTSLIAKAEASIELSKKYDIVFVHIKATDSLSHDRKPKEKKKFIEKIDKQFFEKVYEYFDVIILTGDHTTSSLIGEHTADPVPFMIYTTEDIPHRKDPVKNFSERKCSKGIYGHIRGIYLIRYMLNKMDKAIRYGT